MPRIFCVFLLLGLLSVSSTASSQTAFETFKLALKQDSAIRSSDIEFEVLVESPEPSQEAIRKRTESSEKVLKDLLEEHKGDPRVADRFRKALKSNSTNVKDQMLANSNREIAGFFRMLGPNFGGDRYTEVRVRRFSQTNWSPEISLLTRRLDEATRRSVLLDRQARHASIHGGDATMGIVDPHLLGRIGEPFTSIGRLEGAECSFDTNFELKDPSHVCLVVKAAKANNRASFFGRLVLDPSRDYVSLFTEFGGAEDEIQNRTTCSNFFKEKHSGLWFPSKCRVELPGDEGVTSLNYRFEESGVRLNHPLSSDAFKLEIPRGVAISYKLGRAQSLKTVCSLKIGIDDLLELPKHECVGGDTRSAAKSGRSVFRRLLLLFLAICFLSLCFVAFKKHLGDQ